MSQIQITFATGDIERTKNTLNTKDTKAITKEHEGESDREGNCRGNRFQSGHLALWAGTVDVARNWCSSNFRNSYLHRVPLCTFVIAFVAMRFGFFSVAKDFD